MGIDPLGDEPAHLTDFIMQAGCQADRACRWIGSRSGLAARFVRVPIWVSVIRWFFLFFSILMIVTHLSLI